ncbi:ABC transporter ATP-binding protein [Micromonospora sp. RTGN7]|uniref:ABC transporter ATP-binding protein n=1 Tax=Micromonospora sp. RTGN7 TaxID=3016526 RepID=UPI0029FEE92D|nr:ABC transporter ATP-binding protein [Micromonospora sp. RTGN7]
MRIEIDNVAKGYPRADGTRLSVVENLSIAIEPQEFVCVIGPSGCGKSTLLGLLGGLRRPDSGEIRFVGDRTAGGPLTSIVWQDYALIPWRSIVDNVAFGLELRRVSAGRRREIAREYLTMMGIEAFADAKPHELSGGMRQRAGIARALASDPEVLLMDEPFAAVDAQTRTLLQDELLQVWSQHRKTVLFITHSIEEALLLADRIIVLGPRPTRVVEEIRVPFARPRDRDVELDPRFTELKRHLWAQLRDATLAAEWAEVKGER